MTGVRKKNEVGGQKIGSNRFQTVWCYILLFGLKLNLFNPFDFILFEKSFQFGSVWVNLGQLDFILFEKSFQFGSRGSSQDSHPLFKLHCSCYHKDNGGTNTCTPENASIVRTLFDLLFLTVLHSVRLSVRNVSFFTLSNSVSFFVLHTQFS